MQSFIEVLITIPFKYAAIRGDFCLWDVKV